MLDNSRIIEAWNQTRFPVVIRLGKGEKLRVRLPYAHDNKMWLQGLGKTRPKWITGSEKYWEIPQAWFNDFVNNAFDRHKSLYVIQPYREQEKCAPACMNAQGHECQCSCMGANHGAGNDGSWFEVSETFATRWHGEELACRFMTAKRR